MKQLYTAALLAALGLATVTTTHAANNDVFIGFNDDSSGPNESGSPSPNDYIIDTGYTASQLVTLANGNSGTYSLSSLFNGASFNTAFGPATSENDALDDVAVGAVGGDESGGSTRILSMTVVTGSAPGTPGQANFNSALNAANSITAGEGASGGATTFSTLVAQDPSTPGSIVSGSSVANRTGNNPMEYLVGGAETGQGNLELWAATQVGSGNNPAAFTDLGWFDITITEPGNGSTFDGTISFNVEEVPEPSTYALLGIGGLLAFAARRRFAPRIA